MQRTEAILLRLHQWNDNARKIYERLLSQAGRPVVIVADERNKRIETPRCASKLSLNKEEIRNMGLQCPPDVGWRCGDYGLYLARKYLPNFDRFWLVEHDVHINWSNIRDFFDFFEEKDEDLLCVGLRPAADSWSWAKRMRIFEPNVYFCLFPTLRISGRTLDSLLHFRQKTSFILDDSEYPNDESFVASVAMSLGFRCSSMNGFGKKIYKIGDTFSVLRPYLRTMLEAGVSDNLLYHPALDCPEFFTKARQFVKLENAIENLLSFQNYLENASIEISYTAQKNQIINEIKRRQLRQK